MYSEYTIEVFGKEVAVRNCDGRPATQNECDAENEIIAQMIADGVEIP
jgi:hypothetical protein